MRLNDDGFASGPGAAGYTVNANQPMGTAQPMRQVNDGRDGVGEGEGDLLGL